MNPVAAAKLREEMSGQFDDPVAYRLHAASISVSYWRLRKARNMKLVLTRTEALDASENVS